MVPEYQNVYVSKHAFSYLYCGMRRQFAALELVRAMEYHSVSGLKQASLHLPGHSGLDRALG